MRKVMFAEGEFYHVYNRGTDKRQIFLTPDDHERFVCLLRASNFVEPVHLSDFPRWSSGIWLHEGGETLSDIGAYCLMPNHFHLLLREKKENGISNFVQKLLTGYCKYFNLKHHRTGRLFEGPFRATHVDRDEYLRYLYAYIHLNPVKIKNPESWPDKIVENKIEAQKTLENYSYSSYLDYLGQKRPQNLILAKPSFPNYFQTTREFRDFITDWVEYSEFREA